MKNLSLGKKKVKAGKVIAMAAVISIILNNEIVTLLLLLLGGAAFVCWLFSKMAEEDGRTHYE